MSESSSERNGERRCPLKKHREDIGEKEEESVYFSRQKRNALLIFVEGKRVMSQLEIRKTGRLEPLFIDIHGEAVGNALQLEVTLAIEATVEQLVGAFYMDGSASMQQAGNYGRQGGLFQIGKHRNLVEEAMRVAVPYVVQKDANGRCRVAYWATGSGGREVEVVGEMSAQQATVAAFPGPRHYGSGTYLVPALRDFVEYVQTTRQAGEDVGAALAVIVTDGQFHDMEQVEEYIQQHLAQWIIRGRFPRTVFTLVGVGSSVDEEQLEELAHKGTPKKYPYRPIFCYALAETLEQLPALVSHLLDAQTPAFYGGARILSQNQVVATYEDMVPAVLTFQVPLRARSFCLQVGGQSYTQAFDVVLADH